LMRADGSELHPLTDSEEIAAIFPIWSPDGQWLGIMTPRSPGDDVWNFSRIRPDGTDLTVLYRDVFDSYDNPILALFAYGKPWGAWSPDSQQIVFGANDNYGGLSIMDAEGSDPRYLTEPEIGGLYATWSPDGQWIAFIGNDEQIYRIRPDGSDLLCLTQNVEHTHNFPAVSPDVPNWSPDSQWIVFSSIEEEDDDKFVVLYIARVDGSEVRSIPLSRLTRPSPYVPSVDDGQPPRFRDGGWGPVWSP
jgi:Tol biopolymer transport system component